MLLVFQNVALNSGPQPTMKSVMTGFVPGAAEVGGIPIGSLLLLRVGI